jgi:hypothetical protein
MEMLSRIPEERWKDSDPGLVAFARSGREVKAIVSSRWQMAAAKAE